MDLKITKILKTQHVTLRQSSDIKYIVLHYLGDTGGAKSACEYYQGTGDSIGAHFFVDHNGDYYQSVLENYTVSHCGANGGAYKHPYCRNANSIGIEMCVRNKNGNVDATDKNAGWYFEQATLDAAAVLTSRLMDTFNVPIENVIRHYDVTGKICPAPYCNEQMDWQDFIKSVKNIGEIKEDDGMLTYTEFKAYMDQYNKERAALDPIPSLKDTWDKAMNRGFLHDARPQSYITRQETVALIMRAEDEIK